MESSASYDVVTSGDIKPGFELNQVLESFAGLFQINPAKAQYFFGQQRVLKKGLDIDSARAYLNKLNSIGMIAELKERVLSTSNPSVLELAPTDEEIRARADAEQGEHQVTIECPKCGYEQPKTDACSGCGIIISKYRARAPANNHKEENSAERLAEHTAPDETPDEAEASETRNAINTKALAAAAAVAVLSAFVWKFIAVTFEYELAIIAAIIGVVIGSTAFALGARGQTAGVFCAALALAAIIAGKYMAISSFQSDAADILAKDFTIEELQPIYEMELQAAAAFTEEVSNDATLRQFMVEYGYTEAEETNDISADEISYFNEMVKQRLIEMNNNPPGAQSWFKNSIQEEIANYSTVEIMKENFGLIDLLFLLAGVAAAFRIGSGAQGSKT